MFAMYIVAIGWLFVVALMALTAKSFISGLMTFVWYAALPLALLLWLLGTPSRRKKHSGQVADGQLGQPDRTDTQHD